MKGWFNDGFLQIPGNISKAGHSVHGEDYQGNSC
jgi:hypothetical protein